MSRLRHWLVFSFVWVCAVSLSAQIHPIKHFGLDKSVFPSRIECIAQQQNGNLLVGTLAGLVEYDGYSFETIGVAHGLAESSVSCLASNGNEIWVGHWTGNLTKITPRLDSFQRYELAEAMEFSSIKKLAPEGDDLYILNESGQVFLLDSNGLERMVLPIDETARVIDLWSRNEQVFVVIDAGVLRLDLSLGAAERNWEWVFESDADPLQFVFEWNEGHYLVQTSKGWLELTGMDEEGLQTRPVALPTDLAVEDAAVDLYGNIWLATRSAGAFRFTPASGEVAQLRRSNGLSYDETRAVFVDREGIVWIATAAGLDQYLGEAFKRFDRSYGLPENMVWDVVILMDQLHAATSKGWVKYALGNEAQLADAVLVGLKENEVFQLCSDQQQSIYAITDDGRLWAYRSASDALIEVEALEEEARCIALVNGYLWVGTDDGIVVIDPLQLSLVEKITTRTGLSGNRISGIYYNHLNNETWISALGSDLVRFKEGKFKRYALREDGTPNVIMDAAFDQQGQLWVATYDDGVYVLKGEGFERLQGKADIEVSSSFALAIDEQGSIWMGNNGDLAVYYPALDEYKLFLESDGFTGVEVNPGAMVYHPRTGIWMGTLMGVVNLQPEELQTNPFEPTLQVTQAFLGAHDLLAAERSTSTFGENNELTVRFEGASLMNPEKNCYFYRLKGLHENWRSLDKPQSISYHALPIGSYQFELKACNNSGVCTSNFQVLPFEIAPPFYRTWWFYTLLFLVIVFAIFFMDRYRTVALLEDRNRLAERIEQKEQAFIELDQRTQELIGERKLDHRYMESIRRFRSDREQPLEEVLSGFVDKYQSIQKGEAVYSKSVRTLRTMDADIVILLDVGLSGAAAQAVTAELYLAFRQQLRPGMTPDQVLSTWTACAQGLTAHLKGLRSLDWLLCLNMNQRSWLAFDGMVVHTSVGSSIQRLKARNAAEGMHGDITHDARITCVPERVFEQLNEAGTKTFPEEKLTELLLKLSDVSNAALAEGFLGSFNRWKGAMEQFDDFAVFIWNNQSLSK